VLLALLALPLLAAWYLLQQRQRAVAAEAFAAPRMQPSVAPRRPGWRRHAPMLVFLVVLAALIFAAARPQRTVAVPVQRASIMLATDVSGSMLSTDVQPNRLIAAKRAARQFVSDVPKGVNVGVMAFNTAATVLQSPTRDHDAVDLAIDRLQVSGGTATGQAILTATRSLENQPGVDGRKPPAAIVLISDGTSTNGVDPLEAAAEAKRLNIPIYTVAFGTDNGTITVPDRRTGESQTKRVPPDPTALRQIAEATGGESFTAESAEGLKAVYQRLGSQLGTEQEKHQITAAFAAGGLVLLLAGAALSLGWFGRPI
jgi:Ca-activated chloride channel family protein